MVVPHDTPGLPRHHMVELIFQAFMFESIIQQRVVGELSWQILATKPGNCKELGGSEARDYSQEA